MIQCPAQRFLNIGYIVGSEAGTAVLGMPGLNCGPLLPEQRAALLQFLSGMLLPAVRDLELGASQGLVESLIGDLQRISTFEQERAAEKLRNIRTVMQNELAGHCYLFVPRNRAIFFVAPETFFRLSFPAFPSAQGDMRDACRSYACDLGNASVHHCMGVLEHGLHALARRSNISFSVPLDLENWKNIIDRIEKQVRSLEQQPKGQSKDAALTFLSEAALQFRYFKDAWRNHVEHHRTTYDGDKAYSVLIHVKDFMEVLGGS